MHNLVAKKTLGTRLAAVFTAAFIMTIIFAFAIFTTQANAEDSVVTVAETAAETVVTEENNEDQTEEISTLAEVSPILGRGNLTLLAAGAGGDGGGGGGDASDASDSTFKSVVNFFVKWIKRVGLLVAFVGAVMFALAIKNNDAEQKQAGLLTMVAGFVVAAICQAIDMFDIFS